MAGSPLTTQVRADNTDVVQLRDVDDYCKVNAREKKLKESMMLGLSIGSPARKL